MAKNRKLKDRYSYTLFNIPCEFAIFYNLKHGTPEGIKPPETEEGREVHQIFESGNFGMLKDKGYPDPVNWKKMLEAHPKGINEHPFEYDFQGHIIRGKIDWYNDMGDVVEIVDIKNQYPFKIPKRHYTQLRSYAYPEAQQMKTIREIIYLPRYDSFEVLEEMTVGSNNYKVIERWIEWKIANVEKIKQKTQAKCRTTPSWYCEWCDCQLSCSAAKESFIPLTLEDSPQLLQRLLQVKSVQKNLKRMLEEWSTEHGSVEVEGKLAGFKPPNSTSYDELMLLKYLVSQWAQEKKLPKQQIRILFDFVPIILAIFGVNTKKFNAFLKQRPDVANFKFIELGKPKFDIYNA